MRRISLQRFAQLALCATLAHGALACGADTDRNPPIYSPTGPTGPIIAEAGNGNISTGSGGALGANPSAGGAPSTTGDSTIAATAGAAALGVGGNGSTNSNTFGSGGFESLPFGSSGASSF